MLLAKKRTLYDLLSSLETDTKKAEIEFVQEVLGHENIMDMAKGVSGVEAEDVKKAREALAKDFKNSKKLNAVFMMPKDHLTRFNTLKSLATHGFKFFL